MQPPISNNIYHQEAIKNQILALIPPELASRTWGISAYDLLRQQVIVAHNADMPFPSASLIKLPIVIALYHEAWNNRLLLSETLDNDPELFTKGSGILRNLSDQARLSLRDLAVLMLQVSDNVATNLLIRRLGRDTINGVLETIGLHHTRLLTDRIDVKQLESDLFALGTTSPGEMNRLLQQLARHSILPPSMCADILGIMKRDSNKQRICGNLPLRRDLVIAHKSGTLDGVYHDIGLLTSDDVQYSVAFFCQGSSDDLETLPASEHTIARMSRYLFDLVEEVRL
jgi:beta-lactamase class A